MRQAYQVADSTIGPGSSFIGGISSSIGSSISSVVNGRSIVDGSRAIFRGDIPLLIMRARVRSSLDANVVDLGSFTVDFFKFMTVSSKGTKVSTP